MQLFTDDPEQSEIGAPLLGHSTSTLFFKVAVV